MPSKKKKFNARFPPARIKKIMQTDEEVGKVAAPVPVIISRALELFIESLIVKSSNITKARHAKTLSTAHIKHTILSEKRFDFLKDLVANIADVQADEEGAENVAVCSRNTDIEPGAKTRGRPRKKKADGKPALKPRVKRQKKLDEDPDTEETDTATEEPASDEDEDDNEEEDDDDDEEDTETDPDTQDSPKTEGSVATSLTLGPSSQNLQYGRSSPEPQATCSQLRVNTYPQTKAGYGTNQTLTHSHLDQQTHSLDLRINQNKQSSSDQLKTKSYTQGGQTTSPAATCQGHTQSDGTQSMHSTRSSPTSTQVGDGDCRSVAQSESIGQLKSQCNLQSDASCSEDDGCQQTEAPADQQVSFTVRQMVDKDDDKNKDSVGQENRLQASHSNETIPESDSHAGARLGSVDCAPRDSYPVYGGIPPVSMPFYPHHLGIMQQLNPYPAHMRPMPDGMSPYPPGLMPYQAMAFPGHAVLPHVTHLPSMMDSRFGMPRMNSVSGASVQSGFSESVMAGQPPPAHTKQSQNLTLAHQDKDEHPTS